ncbi:MAG: anthranilate synthase component I [bacterium]
MIEVKPKIDEIKSLINNSEDKYIFPVWHEVFADLETPVSAYHKVCGDKQYSYLLESVEGAENVGRYSFIGIDPLYILKSDKNSGKIFNTSTNEVIAEAENPYELLDNFLKKYKFENFGLNYSSGAIGYFGYDTVRHIEPVLKKQYDNIEECSSFPEAYFMIAGTVIVFDHVKHKMYVINNVFADKHSNVEELYRQSIDKIQVILDKLSNAHNLKALNIKETDKKPVIKSNFTYDEWVKSVKSAKEHILAGDIFQVVLSQRFCVEKSPKIDNLTIYRALRSINPSPYLYFLNFGDFQIVGSSPEIMIKCSTDKIAKMRPIAGTRKRGINAEHDLELEADLLNDQKEVAEHVMLVDLARNDLGRVCKYGTVKVKRFMKVEKYSHVMHIVSDTEGILDDKLSSIDLAKACFPAGTLSGAPKVRAMQLIYELEKSARGPYGGSIGHFGFSGDVNTAITIRTMLIRGNNVYVQAGAGIVADSDPDMEYKETQNKAAALIQALASLEASID